MQEKLKPHQHADALRAIANGEVAEYKVYDSLSEDGRWIRPHRLADVNPITHPQIDWRVKPKTHWINGIECPAPLRELPKEGGVFIVDIYDKKLYQEYMVSADICDLVTFLLVRGLVHATAEAAIANANAMLAFKDAA